MKNFISIISIIIILTVLVSCGKKQETPEGEGTMDTKTSEIKKRIDVYAPTIVKADISHLTHRQRMIINKLVEAGRIADEIFWRQTSPCAVETRDSLEALDTPDANAALKFVKINYGPYDHIEEGMRMVGEGAGKKPAGANFYPVDMSKNAFENYVKEHPEQETELKSQYTIVRRDGDKLITIPYHIAYPGQMMIAELLDEAAEYSDNPSLKKYLVERAKALRTDDYYESDMAWMDVKDNDIDVIIGPIENYEDALFNYRTAYECVVFVRDIEATKELQMFREHIDDFEQRLPYDKKYIRESVGGGHHILNIVNVVYFGGDCQAGVKTIACNLPNDPAVRKVKGGKNTMYKNMMEAKFDKIVLPIAEKILDPSIVKNVDKKAFMSFVTLHEISHTLGRDYIYGADDLPVRKALKERYSAIEETKADILSMCNHKNLIDMGIYAEEYGKKAMATYLAGLYRSIRFGAEEAHGKANLIQLNFLREQGAIVLQDNGKFSINEEIFFDKAGELANLVLTVEAEGDYDGAGNILDKYGRMTEEIRKAIESLNEIPRDLNTSYEY